MASKTSSSLKIERFLLFGFLAIFFGYYFLCVYYLPWQLDFSRFYAGVEALRRNFFAPEHEALAVSGAESVIYTFYHVAIAVFSALLRVSTYKGFQFFACINLSLFICSVLLFFKTFSLVRSNYIGPLFFVLVTLFLRSRVYFWSSETSFETLPYILPYSSFFCWSLALFSFAFAERYRVAVSTTAKTGYLSLVFLFIVVALTSHPITATWILSTLVTWSLFHSFKSGSTDISYRPFAPVVLLCSCGLLLSQLWPWKAEVSLSGFLAFEEGGSFGDYPFSTFRELYLLAIVSSFWFIKTGKHLFWFVSCLVTVALLAAFKLFSVEYGYRYVFFVAFYAQFILAEAMAMGWRSIPNSPRFFRYVLFAALALIAVRVLSIARLQGDSLSPIALLKSRPAELVYSEQLGELQDFLSSDDIVATAPNNFAWIIPALSGAKLVSCFHAIPVADRAQRSRDLKALLSINSDPQAFATTAASYKLTRVLINSRFDDDAEAKIEYFTKLLGEPIATDGSLSLFRVSASNIP